MTEAPHTNGTSDETTTMALLTAQVTSLTSQVKSLTAWDDRLGSTLRWNWHQRIVIFILLIIAGFLAHERMEVRPDILPYLYVVDPDGEVLWKGVPGTFTVPDTFVLNHLEDWVIDVCSRGDDPTLIQLWKAWTRAVGFTVKDSQARAVLNEYMIAQNPKDVTPRPRVDVRVTAKKVITHGEKRGEYRLAWTESHIGAMGQVLRQAAWEADFTVLLIPPKTIWEAEHTNRYGLMIQHITWPDMSRTGGS
jgi:type IV secretory pathway TrbF-like protein